MPLFLTFLNRRRNEQDWGWFKKLCRSVIMGIERASLLLQRSYQIISCNVWLAYKGRYYRRVKFYATGPQGCDEFESQSQSLFENDIHAIRVTFKRMKERKKLEQEFVFCFDFKI